MELTMVEDLIIRIISFFAAVGVVSLPIFIYIMGYLVGRETKEGK